MEEKKTEQPEQEHDEFSLLMYEDKESIEPEPLYLDLDMESKFIDVKNGNYASKAIEFVINNNIMVDYKTDKGREFKGDYTVTREEMAVAFFQFYRYLLKNSLVIEGS